MVTQLFVDLNQSCTIYQLFYSLNFSFITTATDNKEHLTTKRKKLFYNTH